MVLNSLNDKNCFKLICAATNRNYTQVERLGALYSLAGTDLIDISADINVYNSLIEGFNRVGKHIPVCISLGTKGDQHFKKAYIDDNACAKCKKCVPICSQKAIGDDLTIDKDKCIGCLKCAQKCRFSAISFTDEYKTPEVILNEFEHVKIDCIELHSDGTDVSSLFEYWHFLNSNFDGILSLCLSGDILTGSDKADITRECVALRKPYTTIIQADGASISGFDNNESTTQKALLAAKGVLELELPVFVLPSGGTNTKTMALAKDQKLDIHGVSIGSYARKVVADYIQENEFYNKKELLHNALYNAKSLVSSIHGVK